VNFYKHYIGDFQRDTGHLSLAQKGAYRGMLDHYYATERPLPLDLTAIARLVGAVSGAEKSAVESVLREFWVETPDGWINRRAQSEIDKASAQRETNQVIGKLGGRPKKNRIGSDKKTESVSKPEPNNNPNQTPDKYIPPPAGETPSVEVNPTVPAAGSQPPDPPDPDGPDDPVKRLFDLGVAVLTRAGHSERSARAFIGKVRQKVGDEAAIGMVLAAQKTTDPAGYVSQAVRRETTRRVTLC
jgi:uncharacterized protein YdaU (DUF1376 family)